MSEKALQRCAHCGVGIVTFDRPKQGCAKQEATEGRSMCQSAKIMLLESALRRALVPDAFDERARIRPGRTIDVLDAEQAALRQAAALLGPVPATFAASPLDTKNES